MENIWSKIKQGVSRFFQNPTAIYWLGFVAVIAITTMEFIHHGAENYIDFRDATHNFFLGISSYTPEYVAEHGRYYIYSPVFHFLFAPFAYMPFYLGGYAWNLLGWTVFFFAVKWLPGTLQTKITPILCFMLLEVMQSVFCFQYNLLVCCIFLLAFTLLEKDKPFWAVLLIMLSATTKIYGIVELALLFCYPKFWRNIGYALLCGIVLAALPALKLGFGGLVPWYMDWFNQLTDHYENTCTYFSLIWAQPIRFFAFPYMRVFQAGVLAILAVLFLCSHRIWTDYAFKVGVLATLMIYIVIMSEAAEFTTHTISIMGYTLWYFLKDKRSLLDRILFWALFILFGVMPIDIFFPTSVCLYIHKTLWIGVWVFAIAWVRLIWETVRPAFVCKK